MLHTALSECGYEVMILNTEDSEELQRSIHLFHPDYLYTEDDMLVALNSH